MFALIPTAPAGPKMIRRGVPLPSHSQCARSSSGADPALYACNPPSGSGCRHQPASGKRLFWRVLEEIGERDGLSVPQLVGRSTTKALWPAAALDDTNFSSFLRVSCMRYQQLQLAGRIPTDVHTPIRSLDPAWVLATGPAGATGIAKGPSPAGPPR